MTVIVIQREVETVTSEWQEVYFTAKDINALLPYHSPNEVKDILNMGPDHPDYEYISKTLINDHHRALQGVVMSVSEKKNVLASRIETL